MAQTNYTPISLYYSPTAAATPSAVNLIAGELALNTTDEKLYFKNNAGTVKLLASGSGASGDVVGPASATDNALARFDSTTGKLIQNSVGILSDTGALSGITDIAASGSVTLSGGTANGVTYLNGSKVLTSGSALTFDGTTLTTNTLGAFTLAGTVAGAGNQINNVIIGASTPLAVSCTTLSASGTSTMAAINASGSVTLSGTSLFRSPTTSNTPGTFNFYLAASGIREGTAGDFNIDTYNGGWGARLTVSQAGAVTIPGTLAVTGAVSGAAATFTTGSFTTLSASDGTRTLTASPRATAAGNGLAAGVDVGVTTSSVLNLMGGLNTGAAAGGVNLAFYSNTDATWNRALTIRNVAGTVTSATLALMQDGGAVTTGGSLAVTGAVSGAAATFTTGAFSSTLDVTGNVNYLGHAVSGTPILYIGSAPNADNASVVRHVGSNTAINWQTGAGATVGGAYQIIPSTAGGGSTFTTPAFSISNTGAVTIPGTLAVTGAVSGGAATFTGNGLVLALNVTTGTSHQYSLFTNTSGALLIGQNGSAANILLGSTAAYGAVINATTNVPLYFATNNTTRLTIAADGAVTIPGTLAVTGNLTIDTNTLFVDAANNRVGIGTTGPEAKLTVAGVAPAASSPATYPGTIQINETALSTLQAIGGLEFRGAVFGSGYGSKITSSDTGELLFGNRNNSASWSERMRIDSSGNLLVGATSTLTGNKLLIQSDNFVVGINGTNTTGEAVRFYSNGTTCGTISYTASTTAYNTTSDHRLKNNQQALIGSGSFIDALKPKTWQWANGEQGAGFIAHEFQEVSPSSVSGEKDAMRDEEYEVSPAVAAILDEEGAVVSEAVEAVKGTRSVPQYQGMQASSSEVMANIIAELQMLRKRVAELEAAK